MKELKERIVMLFHLDQYFIRVFPQPARALRLLSGLVPNHSSSYVVGSIFPVATKGICCVYLRNHNHLILLSKMFSFWIYSFFYLWERLKAGGEGMSVDEMVGWHHWLDGHECEQGLGVVDGQGSLACCSPWGCKESDTTEQLNWTELILLSDTLAISMWDFYTCKFKYL